MMTVSHELVATVICTGRSTCSRAPSSQGSAVGLREGDDERVGPHYPRDFCVTPPVVDRPPPSSASRTRAHSRYWQRGGTFTGPGEQQREPTVRWLVERIERRANSIAASNCQLAASALVWRSSALARA